MVTLGVLPFSKGYPNCYWFNEIPIGTEDKKFDEKPKVSRKIPLIPFRISGLYNETKINTLSAFVLLKVFFKTEVRIILAILEKNGFPFPVILYELSCSSST
jgi:hypothetical protein